MSQERQNEIYKLIAFLLIMLVVVFVGTTFWQKAFLTTLYWLFMFFLIPYWTGHLFFYKNQKYPKRQYLHKFFGWGSSLFGICWAIGFIVAILSAPQVLFNDHGPNLYFYYLLDQARNWALVGGIGAGLIAASIQVKYYNRGRSY